MAKWGNCDFRQLKNLQKNMQKMVEQGDTIKFCEECARELAARLLAMVIKRTPVGDNQYEDVLDNSGNKVVYKKGKNKGKTKQQVVRQGGTLRRGWTSQTEEEAETGSSKNAKEWANSLNVNKVGDVYQIEVVNPVHYASYVEYGHRQEPGRFVPAIGKRLVNSWVDGAFMLTLSEKDLEEIAPKIIEMKIAKFLEGCFNGL